MKRWVLLFAWVAAALVKAGPTIDPVFPATDNRVSRNAICACGGVLYIGGDFKSVGGKPRDGAAAIEIATGRLLPWAPRLLSSTVAVITCNDSVVYLGGGFKAVEGQKQPYLAAYAPAALGEAKWLSHWLPALDAPVADIISGPEGTIYVGGRFSGALLEIKDAGHGSGQATAFDAQLDGRVTSLLIDPQNSAVLIAGGKFKNSHGQARSLIARLDRKSGQLLPQQALITGGASMEILRMISHSGALYAVGVEIAAVNGEPRANAFAMNLQDLRLKPWRADLDAGAGALSAWGERVVIGGDFRHVNGVERRLAAVDAESGKVLDWDIKPDHNSYAVLATRAFTFISGYWSHLNGVEAGYFAAIREEFHAPAGEARTAYLPAKF